MGRHEYLAYVTHDIKRIVIFDKHSLARQEVGVCCPELLSKLILDLHETARSVRWTHEARHEVLATEISRLLMWEMDGTKSIKSSNDWSPHILM